MTPTEVLREYRRQSDDETRKQAEAFRALSASDQRELLFYMAVHMTKGLQYIHGLVDPVSAKTTDFDAFKTETH